MCRLNGGSSQIHTVRQQQNYLCNPVSWLIGQVVWFGFVFSHVSPTCASDQQATVNRYVWDMGGPVHWASS